MEVFGVSSCYFLQVASESILLKVSAGIFVARRIDFSWPGDDRSVRSDCIGEEK
jgi:hypothetical protein